MLIRIVVSLVLAALAAAVAAPATATAASEPYVAVAGARGPGPAKYNRVFVHRFGSPRATRVLVLVPGYLGGAGDFTQIARLLIARVPNLQVWALDRRENAFEDTSVFRTGTVEQAYDYYFGLKAHYVNGKADAPFVRGWGLTRERAARLREGALVMHAGPMNRGVELDWDVAELPVAVIL